MASNSEGSGIQELSSSIPSVQCGHTQSFSSPQSVAEDQSASSEGICSIPRCLTVFVGILLFSCILVGSVFSKLALVSLTGRLKLSVSCNSTTEIECPDQISDFDHNEAVALYWFLLLLLLIPNLLTFIRSLAFGIIGKTTETYPWPKCTSITVGIMSSAIESFAMSLIVFLVLADIPPGFALFLMNGVFIMQMGFKVLAYVYACCKGRGSSETHNGYETLEGPSDQDSSTSRKLKLACFIIRIYTGIIFLLATVALCIVMVVCIWKSFQNEIALLGRTLPVLILCIPYLSFIWTKKFQDFLAIPSKESEQTSKDNTARKYKSSFIASGTRLLTYPFVTYFVFRVCTTHKIDPWCIGDPYCIIDLQGENLSVFLVQLLITFFVYFAAWTASKMMLRIFSVGALALSTPLSIILYYTSVLPDTTSLLHPFFYHNFTDLQDLDFFYSDPNTGVGIAVLGSVLWIAVIILLVLQLCRASRKIFVKDTNLLLTPHYESIFFEQHMLLNIKTEPRKSAYTGPIKIFICSTMYRENENEMKQLLKSIRQISVNDNQRNIKYESHIFFDGAVDGDHVQEFAQKLLKHALPEANLLQHCRGECANDNSCPESCSRTRTKYGWCLRWELGTQKMPFCIHLKDKKKVKPKKRWSQVMYMKYIIEHGDQGANHNTYILTTDADVDFNVNSVIHLHDRLKSNPGIGGVCARTHPKGSGPFYWYQIFDYAVGHWFQKPAEDIMGSVLCCPGCFSMFRCSALKDVIEEYSGTSEDGKEYLMKNMGEDRWLSTLLIEKNWQMVYCANSSISTFCPDTFEGFFIQRRRWIPSTLANLSQLISKAQNITKSNDHITIIFIIFQAINIFSAAISPATVILVISTGLQSAYGISDGAIIAITLLIFFVGTMYGILCIFASHKTQMDVAKILSAVFVIVMAIVFVGIVKEIFHSIFPLPDKTFLNAPNCTLFQNEPSEFEECKAVARYINSLPNTLDINKVTLPVTPNIIYLGLFGVVFLLAAILHLPEWTCLLHSLWYLLALPCGYLILIIYSAANLDNQDWGTREAKNRDDEGLLGFLKGCWKKMVCCCRSRREQPTVSQGLESAIHIEDQPGPAELTLTEKGQDRTRSENIFWEELCDTLKPDSDPNKAKSTEKSLNRLRNTVLAALFLVNIMWIILLYTIKIPELSIYVGETRAFQLVFLAVYAFIIIVQLIMMLCHRVMTFVHYVGTPSEETEAP